MQFNGAGEVGSKWLFPLSGGQFQCKFQFDAFKDVQGRDGVRFGIPGLDRLQEDKNNLVNLFLTQESYVIPRALFHPAQRAVAFHAFRLMLPNST